MQSTIIDLRSLDSVLARRRGQFKRLKSPYYDERCLLTLDTTQCEQGNDSKNRSEAASQRTTMASPPCNNSPSCSHLRPRSRPMPRPAHLCWGKTQPTH